MSIRFIRGPILVVAGGLLAGGCADNVGFTPLNTPPRALAPRPVDAVEVFAVSGPRRAHTDIGLIEVIGATPPPSTHTEIGFDVAHPVSDVEETHQMIAQLRKRAAQIGCDAIVVTSIDRPQAWVATDTYAYRLPSVQASCVVYN
jgi:hypothetical protein